MPFGRLQRPTLTQLIVDQLDLGWTPALAFQLDTDHWPLPLGEQLNSPPGALTLVTAPRADLISR